MQGKDIDTMSDYHVEVMIDGGYTAHYLESLCYVALNLVIFLENDCRRVRQA